jgi:hypothetical protein
MAAPSSFIVTHDQYTQDCKDRAAVTRWQRPWIYHDRTAWRCAVLWAKDMAARDIHIEMLPMYSEHCLSRQGTL